MSKLKFRLVLERDGEPASGKSAKAFSRQLRITALTMVLSLGLLIAVTVAWFAMNRQVKSDGVDMNIQASANLVLIPVSPSDYTLPTGSVAANALSLSTVAAVNDSVTFTAAAQTLIPATHVTDWSANANLTRWDVESTPTDYTGLEYNNNASAISATTGYAKSGATATFKPVETYASGDSDHYYIDYIVNITSVGTTGSAMKAGSLTATLTAVDSDGDPLNATALAALQDYQKAASVDFYLVENTNINPASLSSSSYKGTLNLAQKNYATFASDTDPVGLVTPGSGETAITIPLASESDYYSVLMRFYFDGNLQKSAAVDNPPTPAQAYVYSHNLSTAGMPKLRVTFTAEPVPAPANGGGGE